MGKIRTRLLGYEGVEQKQKKEQKERIVQKRHRVRVQGLKGGERMVEVDVKQADIEKMEKAKKMIDTKETKKLVETRKLRKKTRGGNYQKAKKAIDKNKKYSLEEAVGLLKKIKYAGFDESVELHLNVDKTGLKGEVELPHATGKTLRIKIVDDKFIEEFGKLDFDILITHPSFIPRLAKLAKILGPKGLMPNPKAGTISDKPEEVAKKFQKGGLRWKTEAKFPLIHQMIGKISFDKKDLVSNATAFLNSVGKNHITSVYIKTTMSPAINISLS